jgi:hypothetical protein
MRKILAAIIGAEKLNKLINGLHRQFFSCITTGRICPQDGR